MIFLPEYLVGRENRAAVGPDASEYLLGQPVIWGRLFFSQTERTK